MSKTRPILLVRNIHLDAFGGAEIYQIALAKELKQLGRQPIIFTRSRPFLQSAKKQGIKTHKSLYLPFQNWSGYRNIFLPFYAIWQFILFLWYLYVIRKYCPQAIHIQSRDDMIAGTLAGRLTNTRVIWTDHTDFRFTIWTNVNKKYKNPIGKLILKLAKYPYRITTISECEYQYITKLIAPQKLPNLIVVKNGVTDRLEQYQSPSEPHTLSYVGRIIDYKGIKELIDAISIVQQKFPDVTLNLYGDGPDLPLFKHYAAKNNHIKFHGHTNQPLKAIAENSIFILPSYHEGLSLSLLDAAMMKKPIIATDVDGNPEVVQHKKTGLLVPPQNEKAIAKAIIDFLKSPKLARECAKNARKLYEQDFNFSTIVKTKLEPLYYDES